MGSSQVVLVGSSSYEHQAQLPAVANNLTRLAELLADPDIGGFDPAEVRVVREAESPTQVLRELHAAAAAAQDRLIVYFAGHGLMAPKDGSLYLALSRSTYSTLHEAVRYEDVRAAILSSPARAKVTVLDCCFSGQAMDGFMGSGSDVADRARITDQVGTYLLTATAETQLALAPPGAEYTAFTGEIINALTEGVGQEVEAINMDLLYFSIRDNLAAKGFPVPQNRERNGGRSIMFARNPRRSKSSGPAPAVAPVETRFVDLPAGHEDVATATPGEVMTRVAELRSIGRVGVAQQILTALGARWEDQELASLIALADDGASEILLTSALARRPEDVVFFLEAAEEILTAAGSDRTVAAVAAARPEQMAAVMAGLRAAGRDGLADRIGRLAGERRQTTEGVLSLVAALWGVGLEQDIDRLLDEAASGLTPAETVNLADALLEAGREAEARRYYLTALDEVAELPPDRIVAVLRSFSGNTGEAEQLLQAAARSRRSLDEVQDLAKALRTGIDEAAATTALTAAIDTMGVPVGVELVTILWRKEQRRDTALMLANRLALIDDPTALVSVVDLLRGLGRPIDAKRLLQQVAGSERFATAVGSLVRADHEEDAQQLVNDFVATKGDNELTTALLHGADAETCRVLTGLVVIWAPERFLRTFASLRAGRTTRDAANVVLGRALASSPEVASTTLALLKDHGMGAELGRIIMEAATSSNASLARWTASANGDPVLKKAAAAHIEETLPKGLYEANQPAAHALVNLVKAGAVDLYHPALLRMLASSPQRLVDLLNQLVEIGEAGAAETVIARFVEQDKTNVVSDLVIALGQRGAPALQSQARTAAALRPDAPAIISEPEAPQKQSWFRRG